MRLYLKQHFNLTTSVIINEPWNLLVSPGLLYLQSEREGFVLRLLEGRTGHMLIGCHGNAYLGRFTAALSGRESLLPGDFLLLGFKSGSTSKPNKQTNRIIFRIKQDSLSGLNRIISIGIKHIGNKTIVVYMAQKTQ